MFYERSDLLPQIFSECTIFPVDERVYLLILKNFENLSQRSKNTLIQYLKGDLNIKNINDIILFNEA